LPPPNAVARLPQSARGRLGSWFASPMIRPLNVLELPHLPAPTGLAPSAAGLLPRYGRAPPRSSAAVRPGRFVTATALHQR